MTDIVKADGLPNAARRVTGRLFLLGVVAVEIIALRHFSTLQYMPLRDNAQLFNQFLAIIPAVVKASLLTGAAALLAFHIDAQARIANADVNIAIFAEHRPARATLVLNLTCFAVLISLFVVAKASHAQSNTASMLMRATPIFWSGMLLSWAGFVAPFSLWRDEVFRHYQVLAFVFVASVFSFHGLDAQIAADLGSVLIKPTLFLASQLYGMTGETFHIAGTSPQGYPVYGSNGFFGEIGPSCSGYEGMVLSATFLGIYFYLEPRKISVLQAAIIILLACLATFLLNAARLAMLIFLDGHFSHEIAQQGFHANFGLLSLVMVVAIAVASTRAFTAPKASAEVAPWRSGLVNIEGDATPRLLIPLIYLIGSSLIVGLFSGKFFWLYPLPILAALAGLIQIRAEFRNLKPSLTFTPFLLAMATFLVWVYLVPFDPQKAEIFHTSLFSAPFPLIVIWLSARLFGAVIIVPLSEELAFRGTFNAMLYARLRSHFAEAAAQAGAIALTAVCFGLVHSNLLAGTIAGLAFGVARWRRNDLGDAVLCHGATNLMLSFYVLFTGEWSYWL